MQRVDIRPLKKRLRQEIKDWRRAMPPEAKETADAKILERICGLREYAACDTVVLYVSMPIEVDTWGLIARAHADGKRVAAPRCVPGTREMQFFLFEARDQLAPQSFGVMEPVPERCIELRNYTNSICIVPALAYDQAGYRLGYGAGYYDRFLARYPGPKIGVVYAENLRRSLWHGRYDLPVDLIVTQRRLMRCKPLER